MTRTRRRTACAAATLLVAALAVTPAVAQQGAAQEQAPAPAPARPEGAAAASSPAPQEPVRITADAAEYFNKEGLAVFTGKVVAVQGDSTLTAERMEVRFTEPKQQSGQPSGSLADSQAGRRISSIVATQSVTLRQADAATGKERYATGEKGVYEADKRLVTLTGSPRLWEGKNLVVGEEMVFRLEDKNVLVRGKVNLTVYPEDSKGAAPAPAPVPAK